MKSFVGHIFLILVIITFSSCTNPTLSPTINYVEKYSQGEGAFNPKYVVYHTTKDSTYLYYQLQTKELLYTRKDKTKPYKSQVKIHWEVYGVEDTKTILDSASVLLKDESPGIEQKLIRGKLGMKLRSDKEYKMYVVAIDKNRKKVNEQIIGVDKSNKTSAQYFMVIDSSDVWPNYDNYTFHGGDYTVESRINANTDLFLKYYQRKFPIAPPPFSLSKKKPFTYKEDSLVVLKSDGNGRFTTQVLDSGFVHIQSDTTKRLGYTFYTHDHNFPEFYDHAGLVPPMRYISSKSEYQKLKKEETSRLEMEQFWIKKCGSKEKAREVIRKYYSRVEVANKSFTSYVQGWQTDRGMISIIFGMPKRIRRSMSQEIWYYGDENNIMALNFVFDKVKNPFTNNDFRLVRTPNYKSNWYRAVDAWRNGRVYWIQ